MKQHTPIRFGLMIAGFILLANPVPLLMDILPDALGYLFLYIALWGVSQRLSYFEESAIAFRRLALLALSKHIIGFICIGIAASSSFNEGAIIPVAAIAYAVGELCLLLPAVRSLFAGFYHLGERWDCHASILPFGKKNTTPETVEWMTIIFFCFRVAMSTLPECILAMVADEDKTGRWILLAYGLAAALAFLLVLVFAIAWAKHLVRYLSVVRASAEASPTYSELGYIIRPEANVSRYRTLSLALMLFALGAILTLDVMIDKVSIVPDYLAGALLLLAALFLVRTKLAGRPLFILCGCYTTFAVVFEVLQARYYEMHLTPENALVYDDALTDYIALIAFAILAELLLIACLVLFYRTFRLVNASLVCLKDTSGDLLLKKRTQQSLSRLSVAHLVLGIAYALAAAARPFIHLSYVRSETVEGIIYEPRLAWYPHAVLLLGVLWCILTLILTARLREECHASLTEE